MLRITPLAQTDEETILRIEGRFTGADVVLVDREIRVRFEQSQRLVLDLQGLKHIDREGLDLLKRWSGETLVLQGCSPFVRTLLDNYGLSTVFE
jgi:anti-anti-sigma regulatory factor